MPMQPHQYSLLKTLVDAVTTANLAAIERNARETVLAESLMGALAEQLESAPRTRCVGADGSGRTPDFAFTLPLDREAPLRVAVELKLYRDRKQGAGELDRGIGQALAYATSFDAVAIVVVFMGERAHDAPPYWHDLMHPFVLEREGRRVPLFFLGRPLA